jgi:hypothetical protein
VVLRLLRNFIDVWWRESGLLPPICNNLLDSEAATYTTCDYANIV